ncbi:hypothetical protein NUW58_g4447 [Xylaria curta]|uniref:Uncharacterized protein n=1 Tax=Xylaria curta TaxID=42375 RepID=A0ACC1P784_9PEZI|nr:hypothetical protein NUW58_g4447 [Xylaria curta]
MSSSTADQFLSAKLPVNYADEEKGFTVWDAKKEVLKQLFLTENCTLKTVKQRMEAEHDFPMFPLIDYETTLRDRYHFRKNLKASDWRSIGYHIEKRRFHGKPSYVYLGGVLQKPRKVEKERSSCLIDAVNMKAMDKVKELLKQPGVDPNLAICYSQAPDLVPPSDSARNMVSPLTLAAYGCDLNIIRILLKHGATVNPPLPQDESSVVPPLFAALQFGLYHVGAATPSFASIINCVCTLLDAGSNVDIYENYRWERPPSHWGWSKPGYPSWLIDYAWTRFPTKISLLTMLSDKSLKMQSVVTVTGVCLAANQGHEHFRQYLASRRLPIGEDRTAVLQIAISEAAAHGLSEAVSCLLQLGVDPNVEYIQDNLEPWSSSENHCIWHPAVRAAQGQHHHVLRVLRNKCAYSRPLSIIQKFFLADKVANSFHAKHNGNYIVDPYQTGDSELFITTALLLVELFRPGIETDGRGLVLLFLKRAYRKNFPTCAKVCDMAWSWGVPQVIGDDGRDALHYAIFHNCCLDMIKFLIARGYRVHSKFAYDYGYNSSNPTSAAETREPGSLCRSSMLADALISYADDRLAIVNFLLEEGVDIGNAREHYTLLESVFIRNSLCWQYRADTVKIFKKLLDANAPVNGPSRRIPRLSLLTSLMYSYVDDSLICEVIKHTRDVDECVEECTPLMAAISTSRLAIAKQLLDRCANVNNAVFSCSQTPLQVACQRGDVPIDFIEDLIKRGADISSPTTNQYSWTALHAAASTGKLNVAALLLKHGAHVNVEYEFRHGAYVTPLDSAAMAGKLDMVHLLRDYLKALGIDTVWSSPFFKSPQADMGYDIADYKDIDGRYGTLEDVDELISELHKRDMKLIVDLVVNHTSDQHPWFLESRSSKSNPKRDWYIWRKPRYSNENEVDIHREPPSNWAQILGEANSAWKYDSVTDEYYLCLFTPEQPGLNWETPEVRTAIWDMHFWLKRGASGFRLDVINMISKIQELYKTLKYFVNGPKLHDYLQEMHREVLSKYDAITVGEMPGVSDENEILRTVGANAGELRMIFIFDLVDIDKPTVRMALKPWDVKEMKAIYRHVGAKLLALMQTTLGGTLFVYQGEELGMRNLPKSWDIDKEYKDVETINYWNKVKTIYADDAERLQHGRAVIEMKARDLARSPMQWDASPNAGFCDAGVTPWMRVNDDYKTVNVEAQMRDKDTSADLTVLQFWQQGIQRRKEHTAVFVYGNFEELAPAHPNVFAYLRTSSTGEKWPVVLNYFGRQVEWDIPRHLKIASWINKKLGSRHDSMHISLVGAPRGLRVLLPASFIILVLVLLGLFHNTGQTSQLLETISNIHGGGQPQQEAEKVPSRPVNTHPPPKYKPTSTQPSVTDPFPLLATSTATPPPIPVYNVPKPGLHRDYGLSYMPPLFIGFTRQWPMLLQCVVGYLTAGWPPESIYVVENTGVQNSNADGKTCLVMSFEDGPDTIKRPGDRDWFFYDDQEKVDILRPAAAGQKGYRTIYENSLRELNHTLENEKRWAFRWFQYDHLTLVNRAALDAVGGWDSLMPYYGSDCDMNARLEMDGWTMRHRRIGIINDVSTVLEDLATLYRDPKVVPTFVDPNPIPDDELDKVEKPHADDKASNGESAQDGATAGEETKSAQQSEKSQEKPTAKPTDKPTGEAAEKRATENSNGAGGAGIAQAMDYFRALLKVADDMGEYKYRSDNRARNSWQSSQHGGAGEPYYYNADGFGKSFWILAEAGREVFRQKWGHRECDLVKETALKLDDQWRVEKDWEDTPPVS